MKAIVTIVVEGQNAEDVEKRIKSAGAFVATAIPKMFAAGRSTYAMEFPEKAPQYRATVAIFRDS